MENKKIKRINTIGKVSKIVLLLAEILIICGIVAAILGGCALLAMPDDFITVNGSAGAEIMIDTDKAPFLMDISDLEDLGETDYDSFDFMGISADIAVSDTSEDKVNISAGISAEDIDAHDFGWALALASFGGAIVLGSILVVSIFGYKLAAAFSKCSSPFEENVIKRMKNFGYSLIPWAIITCLSSNSISLTAVLFAVVVILFIQIFSYGAKLQQENDDTV